ncbi:lysophospholipid acyltransferase family protein [Egbenema bharatensis]|uniref:lysophospholipid acyltransferase family protein n=1 Tax=Egbenema bharatensis TaxID=3463334 RepID=UPI003A86DFB4
MVLLRLHNFTQPTVSSPTSSAVQSRFSPWLTPIVYFLGCWFVLPAYFRMRITGQENIPEDGPVILAPTHRSRWDALLVPYAAGRFATGRDIHFMVTSDEVKGFQGWLIRRLGGFPVNPRNPGIGSLRHGVEVLQNREMMVIFPEGGIFRDKELHPLKPGLARLAIQAGASQPDLNVKIVPVNLDYNPPIPKWGCKVNVSIGKPIEVSKYLQGNVKQNAQALTDEMRSGLTQLIEQNQIAESGELAESNC